MKVNITRSLRTDKALKATGWQPIALTVTWAGLRKRFVLGTFVDPKNWDPDKERVKPRKPYDEETNALLDEWEKTIRAAAQTATSPAELGTAVLAALAPAKLTKAQAKQIPVKPLLVPNTVSATAPQARATASDLPGLWAEWVESYRSRVSRVTGQLVTATTIEQYAATGAHLVAWAKAHRAPLTLASVCSKEFYESFRAWVLRDVGAEANTFGKYVKHLKNFLGWCEEQDDESRWPPSPRWRKFEAPSRYVGVDSLDVEEVRAIQDLDFRSEDVRAAVEGYFAKRDALPGTVLTRGQRRSQADERRIGERLRALEEARDIFLMACYTGLRISDLLTLGPQHLRGDTIQIDAGKNKVKCVIPFFDDGLMRPGELVRKYAGRTPTGRVLPVKAENNVNAYLPQVAELAGITRLHLTTKLGRKTFVTLSVYNAVPVRVIMQATGHQTETSFNRYLGVNVHELVKIFKKRARPGLPQHSGGIFGGSFAASHSGSLRERRLKIRSST